jgi:zinc protease
LNSLASPTIVVDRSLPLLHASVGSRRGSVLDPQGKEGATKLLLRLMKRSVVGMDLDQVDENLDAMGATLAAEVGRSVSAVHGGTITRSSADFLELLLRVLATPAFSSAEFERLVAESQAEWVESLDNDSLLARRFFSRAFFHDHAYGRLSGGTPASLSRITLDDLKILHARIFAKENLHLGFSGDVPLDLVQGFVEKLSEKLPQVLDPDVILSDPIGPQGRHLTFIDKPERTQTQILIGCLGTHPRDDDHTALSVGHVIFGGTFSGRLSKEVRGKRGWSYGAYSDLPIDRKRQAFSLWTFPQASDAADCIQLELNLLREFIEKGVTEEELIAAQSYLENSHVFSVDTAAKRASLALDRKLYDLPDDYHDGHIERVRGVTVTQVQSALEKRLSYENLEITVLGTHREIGARVERCIENLAGLEVIPFDHPE